MNDAYLKTGTLYVQSMGNHFSGRSGAEEIVNRPGAIDATFANAGFTSEMGHPAFLYESLANPIPEAMTPEQRGNALRGKRTQLGDAYWYVESKAQLDEVWPKYLASDPDLLKIFLVNSAHRDENKNGIPGSIGLDPKVVPAIIARAHASGLRVYAHVDTELDAQIALSGGVDGLGHMPGYGMGNEKPDAFRLSPGTAILARNRFVQPTLSIAKGYAGKNLPAVVELQKFNLDVLDMAGAKLVIGSDSYGSTEQSEVETWLQFGLKPAKVLRSLSQLTPQSIFPERAIGKVAEEFEATFVLYGSNPLEHPDLIFRPSQVWKQGKKLR
jgi:hypothetical protein